MDRVAHSLILVSRAAADKFLKALLNSALVVDRCGGPAGRREADLTPAEHAHGEAWRRFNRPRPGGKRSP
jgi:hypothetical protein